jgi:hypothetical protein
MEAASPVTTHRDRSPGSPDVALHAWMKWRESLSYSYTRSDGAFIETGQAVIGGLDTEYIELKSSCATLLIALTGAKLDMGPQRFFAPGFASSRLIDRVSIQLASGDWLFLCPRQDGELFVHGHILPRP